MMKMSLSRRLKQISALLVILAGWTSASGRTIYVDAHAPGIGDGTSWENAYRFLQDALAEARTAGGNNEIRVAQGVYTPDRSSDKPEGTGDREASFELLHHVPLMGGYAGYRGADPNARDFSLYEAILSGDLDGNDGPDFANYDENSYHVVSIIWSTPTLEGFTITGGNADGKPTPDDDIPGVDDNSGGGIYCSYYTGATITNCILLRNKAMWGGGMYNNGDLSRPKLIDCVFMQNVAFSGGGVFTGGLRNYPQDYDCQIELNNCIFEENSAEFGGAISSESYKGVNSPVLPTVTDCEFRRNMATFYGGAIYNNRADLNVAGCRFVENATLISGGLTGGGAMYSSNWGGATLNVANCIFTGNVSAGVGGALYVGSCRSLRNQPNAGSCGVGAGLIDTSTFVGNRAAYAGGAICWGLGQPALMTNCILWGNSAPAGRQMAVDPHNSAFSVWWSDVEGGRMAVHYIEPDCRQRKPCFSDPNNTIPDANCFPCTDLHRQTLVEGWWYNIEADPCFADPGYWHDNDTPNDLGDDYWIDGDYHLKSQTGRWDPVLKDWVQDFVTSPCIDTGDPSPICSEHSIPPCLEQFPHASIMNMGAYGRRAEASKACFPRSSCGVFMQGDLNGDCVVNGVDLSIMAEKESWHIRFISDAACDAIRAGDMDSPIPNRRIDKRDLEVFAEHWLEQN